MDPCKLHDADDRSAVIDHLNRAKASPRPCGKGLAERPRFRGLGAWLVRISNGNYETHYAEVCVRDGIFLRRRSSYYGVAS
jgi:hypothetical protein